MDGTADGCLAVLAACFLQVMLSCSMQAARLLEFAVVAPLTQVFLQLRKEDFAMLVEGEG